MSESFDTLKDVRSSVEDIVSLQHRLRNIALGVELYGAPSKELLAARLYNIADEMTNDH